MPLLLRTHDNKNDENANDKHADHSHDPIKVSPPLSAVVQTRFVICFELARSGKGHAELTCAFQLLLLDLR